MNKERKKARNLSLKMLEIIAKRQQKHGMKGFKIFMKNTFSCKKDPMDIY